MSESLSYFTGRTDAHIRKTGPRDGRAQTKSHSIKRRGIAFGDELRSGETHQSGFVGKDNFLDYEKENLFRCLLFVCYQSDLGEGFKTVQAGEPH